LVSLLILTVLVFAVLAVRVVQLQALDPERFVALSDEQTVRTQTLAADRGSILDRNGYELALSIPMQTVYTDPKFVDDPQATAARLAPVLGLEAGDLEEALGADNRFGYLARQVSDEVADQVEALALDGVYLLEEPHRFTPAGTLASSVIGLTDIDNQGLGGIELQYEAVLRGTPGSVTFEQDPEGRTIPEGERSFRAPEPGDGVMLTIDRGLQHEAERVLADHVESNGAEGGTLVAMDPASGEILAMANVARDPDHGEVVPTSNNLALTTVYEPGSVMKVVGMSGALEDGLVSPGGSCVAAPDSMVVGGSTFSEYHPHGGGCWPIEEIIVNSSNTGSINVAQMLGPERLFHYFTAFGLGQPTDLGFPNELSGSVRPVEEWWGTSIGSMPIGQGISVTPLQMLLAYNAIANDGEFVPAQLVRATVDAEGLAHLTPTPDTRRVVSAATARQMRDMFVEVVTRGTAQAAQVEGMCPAGKTGTAQIPAPDGGYVFPDGTKHYMATFVGVMPADNPRLSVIVVTQHPTAGAYTGGAVSAPVFADFARFAAGRLQIAPCGLELGPEQLDPDDLAQPDPERFFTHLGEPPEGLVRAEPAQTPVDDPVTAAGPAPTSSSAGAGGAPGDPSASATLSG
jgi:cell division protein FtsI (penicillin-binding protein 3)